MRSKFNPNIHTKALSITLNEVYGFNTLGFMEHAGMTDIQRLIGV